MTPTETHPQAGRLLGGAGRSPRRAGQPGHLTWPSDLRPADEFYLLAHEARTGDPLLHPLPLGWGTAGALLTELVLTERISVAGRISTAGPIVTVISREPTDDALATELLGGIASQEPALLREWLAFLAPRCVESTAARLVQTGLLVPQWRQRHGRRPVPIRYVPSNPDRAYWRTVRLARLYAEPIPDPDLADTRTVADDVLAGLVTATSLLDAVVDIGLPGAEPTAARHRIDHVIDALPADLAAIVAAVQRGVGDAVLSART